MVPTSSLPFGSQGRGEVHLTSDQDHGLIYAAPEAADETEAEELADWFRRLGQRVTEGLGPAEDGVTWSGRMRGGLDALSSLGNRMTRAGIAVAEVRVREPGLRGVFFRVTGREFES